MRSATQGSVRRRPDGSLDVAHYVAVAHRDRADESRAIRAALCAALQHLLLRCNPSRAERETVASAATRL
jgi:hypothetical protein